MGGGRRFQGARSLRREPDPADLKPTRDRSLVILPVETLAEEVLQHRTDAPDRAPAARTGRQALQGLCRRLRHDGRHRRDDDCFGLSDGRHRQPHLRRSQHRRRCGRSAARSSPSTSAKGFATYGQQVVLSRIANNIIAEMPAEIFDKMLAMDVELLQRPPFDRIHRAPGLHFAIGERHAQPADHRARRATC